MFCPWFGLVPLSKLSHLLQHLPFIPWNIYFILVLDSPYRSDLPRISSHSWTTQHERICPKAPQPGNSHISHCISIISLVAVSGIHQKVRKGFEEKGATIDPEWSPPLRWRLALMSLYSLHLQSPKLHHLIGLRFPRCKVLWLSLGGSQRNPEK